MTKREEELKELFQKLATKADNYYELENSLDSFMDSGKVSFEDYDIICKHWDEWLED